MLKVEIDGLWISVPLKPHMSADEFLAIADKLERFSPGREQPTMSVGDDFAPPARSSRRRPSSMPLLHALHSSVRDTQDDLRFMNEHDKRLGYVIDHLKAQLERVEQAERRLERQEAHTQHILEYLQSLDRYIRQ